MNRGFGEIVDNLGHGDLEADVLPPYTMKTFVSEYPGVFIAGATLVTVAVSVCAWRALRSKRGDNLLGGRFNTAMIKASQQRAAQIKEALKDTSFGTAQKRCSASNEDEEGKLDESEEDKEMTDEGEAADCPLKEAAGEIGSKANNQTHTADVLPPLPRLHGKLATFELRARAKKIENSMTAEEKVEEQRIREKQLESIFELMKSEPEKFGMQDKTDLMDQMKLYTA